MGKSVPFGTAIKPRSKPRMNRSDIKENEKTSPKFYIS